MFIAGNAYPQSLEDIQQAAPAFTWGGTPTLAPITTWKRKTQTDFDSGGEDSGTIISGDGTTPSHILIIIPENIIAITSVRLDGNNYAMAVDASDKKAGYYFFDPFTNFLYVYYRLPYKGGRVFWQGISKDLSAATALINCVEPPYSEILKEWNVERFSISRSLQNSPTASLSFSACSDKETEVRLRFKPGQRVNLSNIPFRVSQLQIERVGDKVYPNYSISVTVSLEWYLSETFSDSILNKSPAPQPIATGQTKKKLPSTTKKVDIYTVIATGAGMSSVKGSAGYSVEVPTKSVAAPVDPKNYSSIAEALTDGAAKSGAFVYRGGDAIASIKWGEVPTHFLSPAEIESDLSFNISLPEAPDTTTDNTTPDVTGEEEETTEEEQTPQTPERDKEEITETTRTEFENAESVADLSIAPYQGDADGTRTPNVCFDTGGVTKKMRVIKERGGALLEQTEQVWGYAFISKDVHAFYPDRVPVEYPYIGSGLLGWQKVQETRTTNYYDELGYLVKTETTGYKLSRAKQESDILETCSLYMNALIAGLNTEDGQRNLREIANYEFSGRMPIYDVTTYTLEKMSDYYRDIVRSSEAGWIEPKFCSKMVRSQIDRILAPNPLTDEDGIVRPPVVQVTELTEETRTIITNTKSTPERFKVNQYSRGAEGQGARDRVVIASSIENLGRPSTHTTIPIQQIFWQDLIKKPTEPEDDKTEEEKDKKEEAQKEITQKTIASSRDETLSFSMKYHSEFKEGDKVFFDGRTWVILDINAEFICSIKKVVCDSFNLTLGSYKALPITIDLNQFTNVSLKGVTNG